MGIYHTKKLLSESVQCTTSRMLLVGVIDRCILELYSKRRNFVDND